MTPFELLQSLCLDRETGMLFAVMEGNRQLRIGLIDGVVVHITYALKRGPITLELLAMSHALSASFSRGMVGDVHPELPPTVEILHRLQRPLSTGACPESALPPRPQPEAAAGAAANVETTLIRDALPQLRALLIDYIGPIGEVLIDEELQKGYASWEALVDRLAQDVTPESAARAFRQAARRLHR
jgi:hypothetical protein